MNGSTERFRELEIEHKLISESRSQMSVTGKIMSQCLMECSVMVTHMGNIVRNSLEALHEYLSEISEEIF